jgi:hypothetical protein
MKLELRQRLEKMAAEVGELNEQNIIADYLEMASYLNKESRKALKEPNGAGVSFSDELYRAAREISEDRSRKLRALRAALSGSELDAALAIARQLCGIEKEDPRGETSNPINSRIN